MNPRNYEGMNFDGEYGPMLKAAMAEATRQGRPVIITNTKHVDFGGKDSVQWQWDFIDRWYAKELAFSHKPEAVNSAETQLSN